MDARCRFRGPFALAVVAGCLLAWGAFTLLQYTDDEDLGLFWIRLAVGTATAAGTVWAAWNERRLLTTFLALACCITPVGAWRSRPGPSSTSSARPCAEPPKYLE